MERGEVGGKTTGDGKRSEMAESPHNETPRKGTADV